jgi:TraM recognition site of TraD and TraG
LLSVTSFQVMAFDRHHGVAAPAIHVHGPAAERVLQLGFQLITLGLSGVAVGTVAAIVLRRRRFAADWGLTALVPGMVGVGLLAAGAPLRGFWTAVVLLSSGAVVGCVGFGAMRDMEERRAGGDHDSGRVARRGIFDPVRRWFREGGARHVEALRGGVPVGRTHRGELAFVARGDARSGAHVLIPGATGAGKTTSLAALLVDYVVRSGFGAVVLEAKTDPTLFDAARTAARSRGVPFHFVSPTGPARYDPLAHGSVDERSERLIAVEGWGSSDADFYRQASSPFLRLLVRMLDGGGRRVTLASVAENFDPDRLMNLAQDVDDEEASVEASRMVEGLGRDQRRAVAGLAARLQNISSSGFAREWLDPEAGGGAGVFDLRSAIESGEVVYFRFDTDRTGNVGRAIAQMVLLDLGACASAMMGRGVGTFVGIDEFGALEAPALDRLYARGRAAGFSVAVGTQTLADLRAAGPAVRERVGATISGLVCHRIGEQADAEWVGQLIGAVPTWQTVIRTQGFGRHTAEGSRSRGYRFEVNPSELQRLGSGEVFVARLDEVGPRRAWRARVVPPWQRVAGMAAR